MDFFFLKNVFGLDISDYSIEVLELKRSFKKTYLSAYGRVILEKGIVENGEILDKKKLEIKIKDVLKNTIPRKIKSKKVIISLPESKTFTHFFGEIENIQEEAERNIPWQPEEIYFDIKNGFYAASPKKIVEDYLEVFKESGLDLLVLDIESSSLVRAFESELDNKETFLIMDIGARTTNLVFVEGKQIKMSDVIYLAGNNFTDSISKKLNISFEEAEKLKIKYGFNPGEKGGEITIVLQSIFQDILKETRQAINFYEDRNNKKVKQILLCGGSSSLPKIDFYIASNLDIKTKIPNPWQGIDTKNLFKSTVFKPVFFANVIGLAKRGLESNIEENGINLKPKNIGIENLNIDKHKSIKGKILKIIAFVFIILSFGVFIWILYSYFFRPLPKNSQVKTETKATRNMKSSQKKVSKTATTTKKQEIVPSSKVNKKIPEKKPIPVVVIQKTGTGWLRVRKGPGTNYPEIGKVYPGKSYLFLQKSNGWYKIKVKDGEEGWVSAKYSKKQQK